MKNGFKIIVSGADKDGALEIERYGLSPADEEVLAGAHVLQGPANSSAADNDGGSDLGGRGGDDGGGHGGDFGSEG